MGETNFKPNLIVSALENSLNQPSKIDEVLTVSTPGGTFHVRWDEEGTASPLGQLSFFGEFIDATDLFASWVKSCPLIYTSPNAPKVIDVLGTWFLSILDGHHRYAHVARLRGDKVAPCILDMTKIVSDESLRRALAHLAPKPSKNADEAELAACTAQWKATTDWMDSALSKSTREALSTSWILDVDTTVKLLYGNQEGAEVGYNPTKPGRPSHNLHTYWIGNLRMVLDVELQPGKISAAKYSLPRLIELIKGLSSEERPSLVRGDNAFGVDGVMLELESMGQPYLFKQKQTPNVKKLIERYWNSDEWKPAGQGIDAVKAELQIDGWKNARQVIILLRQHNSRVEQDNATKTDQLKLNFIDLDGKIRTYEYVVLTSNANYDLEAYGQLYRDRADCENGFDELKNQWGWGGYVTQDIERCKLSARAVALVYNWWSWYTRLAHPNTRLEAITSRPLLLNGVARLTEHAGQSRLLLTLSHGASDKIKEMVHNIRKGINYVKETAPQLAKSDRWPALLRYIVEKIIAAKTRNVLSLPLAPPHLAIASG